MVTLASWKKESCRSKGTELAFSSEVSKNNLQLSSCQTGFHWSKDIAKVSITRTWLTPIIFDGRKAKFQESKLPQEYFWLKKFFKDKFHIFPTIAPDAAILALGFKMILRVQSPFCVVQLYWYCLLITLIQCIRIFKSKMA